MADGTASPGTLAVDLQRAYETRDLELLGSLLTDDARWGDDDGHPRSCRSRADVVRTFARLMEAGVGGRITELHEGPEGIVCRLAVDFPEGVLNQDDDHDLFHVYHVRDGRISEIRRFNDRQSAIEAAGL
jgi:ketosteroid isomerase-like protein